MAAQELMERGTMLEYYRFKEISDLFATGKPEEAKLRLMELQARYVHLCDENTLLRTQMQGYEDILYLSRNLIFDGTYYWLITGSIKQGPFCPTCYNRDGLLLRLADDGVTRRCGVCSSRYERNSNVMAKAVSGGDTSVVQRQDAGAPQDSAAAKSRRKATVIPFGK